MGREHPWGGYSHAHTCLIHGQATIANTTVPVSRLTNGNRAPGGRALDKREGEKSGVSVGPARGQFRDRGVNWGSQQGISLRPTRERRQGLSRATA